MEAISVSVRRGATVEARHRVHAVAVRDGEVVAAAGDPALVCLFRSSAKPIQALLLARVAPRPRRPGDSPSPAPRTGPSRRRSTPCAACSRSACDGGRPRVRGAGGPRAGRDPPQLLGEARRLPRRVPRARLGDGRLPARRPPAPAGAARGGRARPRTRRPRSRRPSTAAASLTFALSLERMAAFVRATRRARRRRPHPRRDARAPRARGRRGLARHRPHAPAAGLGGEGWRRGAAVRPRRPTEPATPSSPRTAISARCARRSRDSSSSISVAFRSSARAGRSSGRWSWSDGSRT